MSSSPGSGWSGDPDGDGIGGSRRDKIETRLPPADEFEINGGEQIAIDLRSVADAPGRIDGPEMRGCAYSLDLSFADQWQVTAGICVEESEFDA